MPHYRTDDVRIEQGDELLAPMQMMRELAATERSAQITSVHLDLSDGPQRVRDPRGVAELLVDLEPFPVELEGFVDLALPAADARDVAARIDDRGAVGGGAGDDRATPARFYQ